ncbi:MAG: glycosyltransferase family 4 protein [Nitrospirae bacterium]|nr:glycosyltransferase family 4 protein [Nitrospirota bacterium]
MTCWAILQRMREAGHRVTVVALRYPGDVFASPEREEIVRSAGADLAVLETGPPEGAGSNGKGGLGRWLSPDPLKEFPTGELAPRMRSVIETIRPDAMFVYHWDTLAATHGLRVAPRMAGVGDPWHLPTLQRWRHAPMRLSPEYLRWTLGVARFQARETRWLQQRGGTACAYFRSPITDSAGPEWQRRRSEAKKRGKPVILLGPSNLEGTSTSAGLRLFADEILPRVEAELGREGFLVRIVGEGSPPKELARILPRPSVELLGRIEPADQEFIGADVHLVPTPFVLGIRLRIVTGMSFGCCIVAHQNEAANLPELVDGENSLLGRDGTGLAKAIVKAVRDRELREHLGRNARRTYERFFSPEAAASPIVEELENLVRSRGPRPPGKAPE